MGSGAHDTRADRMEALQVEAMLLGEACAPSAGAVCRICLESECAPGDRLLSPCRCRGTMQSVHASCLDRWRMLARHSHSVVGCDQCGAEYRFASTWGMRVLASRAAVWAATVLVFAAAVVLAGALGSALMRKNQPGLFLDTHPYIVQSATYCPTLDRVPLHLRALEAEQHASYEARGLESFWDYLLGPIDDAYVDDDDEAYATMYSLGIFRTSALVQLVQGMLQRLLQALDPLAPRGAAPPYVLRHTYIASVAHTDAAAAAAPPALGAGAHLVWWTSLGLALLGITSVPSMLVVASIVGPFRVGTPFSIVGYSEHPAPGASGAPHAHVVWQCINLFGLFLLGMVLWGIVRSFLTVHTLTQSAARHARARLSTRILDYDERAPRGVVLPDEAQDTPGLAARLRALGHAGFWLTHLMSVASLSADPLLLQQASTLMHMGS